MNLAAPVIIHSDYTRNHSTAAALSSQPHPMAQNNVSMPPLHHSSGHSHPQHQQQQPQQHQQKPSGDAKAAGADAQPDTKDDKTAPVRKRLSLACTTCRQRKVKCDGGRPSCRTCAKFSWPCVYQPSNRKRGPRPRALALMDGSIPYSRSHWHAAHGYYAYGFPGRSPPPPPPPQHLVAPYFGQPHDIPMNGAPVALDPAHAQPGGYNRDSYSSYGDYMSNTGAIRIHHPPQPQPPPPQPLSSSMRSPMPQQHPHTPARMYSHRSHCAGPRLHEPMGVDAMPPPPSLLRPSPYQASPGPVYAQGGPHPQGHGMPMARAQSPFSPTPSSSGFSQQHALRPHYARPDTQPLVSAPEPAAPTAQPLHAYAQHYGATNGAAPRHGRLSQSPATAASEKAISVVSLTTPAAAAAAAAATAASGLHQAELVSANTAASGVPVAESEIHASAGARTSSLGSAAPQPLHPSAQSYESASSYAAGMQSQSKAAEMHIPAIYARNDTDIAGRRDSDIAAGFARAMPQPPLSLTPATPSQHYASAPTNAHKRDQPLSSPIHEISAERPFNDPSMTVPVASPPVFNHAQLDSRLYAVRSPGRPWSPSSASSKPLPFSDGASRPKLPPLSEIFGKDYQSVRSPGGLH